MKRLIALTALILAGAVHADNITADITTQALHDEGSHGYETKVYCLNNMVITNSDNVSHVVTIVQSICPIYKDCRTREFNREIQPRSTWIESAYYLSTKITYKTRGTYTFQCLVNVAGVKQVTADGDIWIN